MYGELVKELRDSAEWADRLALLMGRAEGDTHAPIMRKAADAIEELSKPSWIPVTERLPEKTNHYLVHVKCGCDGKFASAWEQVAWFCEKFYWEHLHGDDVFEETITHWMPLPEPPKEET